MGKPFYSKEDVQKADEMDINLFLNAQGQQTKRQGKEQMWTSPEGYKISINGNRWFSHYEKVGGFTVAFVRRYFHLDMYEAMKTLVGNEQRKVPMPAAKVSAEKEKLEFAPPPRNDTCDKVCEYLCDKRLIAPEIVDFFLENGSIYETKESIGTGREINNLALCGMNTKGKIKQVHIKGMGQSGFRRNAIGSDQRFGFGYFGDSDVLMVFESGVDLMSYLTIASGGTSEWKQFNYVALDGVSEHALLQALEDHPKINRVMLDLDHDIPGMDAARRLTWKLWEHGYNSVYVNYPAEAKDWNELLKKEAGQQYQPAVDYPNVKEYRNRCNLIIKTGNEKDFYQGDEVDIKKLAGHIRDCWQSNKNSVAAHELNTVGAYAYNLARKYMHSMQYDGYLEWGNMLANGYTPDLLKMPKEKQMEQFNDAVDACSLSVVLGAVDRDALQKHVENLLKLSCQCASQSVGLVLSQEVAPCLTMG